MAALNGFFAAALRRRSFVYPVRRIASVEDVVEVIGVPDPRWT